MTYKYSSNGDPTKQAVLIQDAVNSKVDGLAVSVPDPASLYPTIAKATAAGIPVVMFNAGFNNWQQCGGSLAYFGQNESLAGQNAGKRLAAAGAKKVLCVLQAQGQVQLEARCAGVAQGLGSEGTMEKLYVNGTDPSAVQSTMTAKLTQDKSIDAVITPGAPEALIAIPSVAERGIATVYQDLAVVSLMPVWRNFFLGNEVRKGLRMDIGFMRKTCKAELLDMGVDLRDVDQPIGTLSGGERQCVAISRAVYFGAKVLILDEPTAALGVKQSGVVLKYIIQAKERHLGVIFITHNPYHAYPVGDRFLLLNRGKSVGYYRKDQISREELTGLMAGGGELEQLSQQLENIGGRAAADAAHVLEEEADELGNPHQPTGGA